MNEMVPESRVLHHAGWVALVLKFEQVGISVKPDAEAKDRADLRPWPNLLSGFADCLDEAIGAGEIEKANRQVERALSRMGEDLWNEVSSDRAGFDRLIEALNRLWALR